MTIEECKEKGIRVFPDNDGGLWHYSENGMERVRENENQDKQ